MPKQVIVRINANVSWRGFRDPESGTWIGVCDVLNLNAVGETWAELQACANEAMELLFQDLFEDGELDAVLRLNGWTPVEGPLPPRAADPPKFDIKYDLRELPREFVAV